PGPEYFEPAGRCPRDVDQPLFDKGPPAIDGDFHVAAIRKVFDAPARAERQGAVRPRHLFHVVDLPASGGAAGLGVAVPTGNPFLGSADRSAWRQWGRGSARFFSAAGQEEQNERDAQRRWQPAVSHFLLSPGGRSWR